MVLAINFHVCCRVFIMVPLFLFSLRWITIIAPSHLELCLRYCRRRNRYWRRACAEEWGGANTASLIVGVGVVITGFVAVLAVVAASVTSTAAAAAASRSRWECRVTNAD